MQYKEFHQILLIINHIITIQIYNLYLWAVFSLFCLTLILESEYRQDRGTDVSSFSSFSSVETGNEGHIPSNSNLRCRIVANHRRGGTPTRVVPWKPLDLMVVRSLDYGFNGKRDTLVSFPRPSSQRYVSPVDTYTHVHGGVSFVNRFP